MGQKVLTIREKSAIDRIAYMKRAVSVLSGFLECGFRTLAAITAIVEHYDKSVSRDDMFNFWNFKNMNYDVLGRLEKVLQQLKSE